MLREIPGILPAKTYPGCTRNAYHLYMFRYRAEAFAGLPRDQFLRALHAEGIPCSGGYTGTELEFVIMVIAVSCVKLLSAHNSTQHTSRKHKV
jgi:DegT/DnrJ/EryC1/StrS aminotransferase family.